ncbi:MAG: hypothetical protein ACP5FK_08165 [bacterium]
MLSLILLQKVKDTTTVSPEQVDSITEMGKGLFLRGSSFCCGFWIALGVVIAAIITTIIIMLVIRSRKYRQCPRCKSKILKSELICPICNWEFHHPVRGEDN